LTNVAVPVLAAISAVPALLRADRDLDRLRRRYGGVGFVHPLTFLRLLKLMMRRG
jgi:hypothetical protein